MIMTLCARCAGVIYDDPKQSIKRVDYWQTIKEPCMICDRLGFDYDVHDKPHFCAHPGCDEIAIGKYCPMHKM